MNDKIDLRYKQSQDFINKGIGKPVYKRRAFSFINKILGPQSKWINKSPEEYFTDETLSQEEQEIQELKKAAEILGFTSRTTFKDIKKKYWTMAKGDAEFSLYGNYCSNAWHPDLGGHPNAFAILNHAYNLFKQINYNN